MQPRTVKKFLFFVVPQLRWAQRTYQGFQFVNDARKHLKNFQKFNKSKMRLPIKVLIGSGTAFAFILTVGFIMFPHVIKNKVKEMTALKEGNDIRGMFLKVPFALDFKIYLFNVKNPMEVQNGAKPIVEEVGPFCYEEWKEKVDVHDIEEEDMMMYNTTDTFLPAHWPGCADPDMEVTVAHPLIVGLVNAVTIQKPGALSLLNKAIKSIFSDQTSIFLKAKAKNILFGGVTIKCGVKDFAGRAICTQLKGAGLPQINDEDLAFSIFGAKNATPGKRFLVYRGIKDSHRLGQIVKYDDKPVIDNWPTKQCNEIHGTDGTIFPPFLTEEEGLVSFAPDLCRSLGAFYVRKDTYDGIPVRFYTANLGDASKNADEKCYCTTPETCLKKGLMDLYKCTGIPIYASLPHFLDCDKSYLDGVQGLNPETEKHQIIILFEPTTGGPVYAKKRLQFNVPLGVNDKIDLFSNLPTTVLPLFWIEEGVELNITFTKQLKDFFKIKKIVKLSSWTILIGSLGGIGVGGYLFFKKTGEGEITPVQKVEPVDTLKNTIHNMKFSMEDEGHINHGMNNNDPDKF